MTSTNTKTASVEALRELTKQIAALEDARRELARALPPITLKDVCPDGHNVEAAFERDVRRFMADRMQPIDVTMLDPTDEDEAYSFDKIERWELLTPRYEVRELDATDDEGEPLFGIFDHDEGGFVDDEDDDVGVLKFDDESDADDRCSDLNNEDKENLHGFPFAWNIGWIVDHKSWIDDLRACGFLVYRFDGDKLIAGIDGGGYSFMGAHFAPFYARLAARNEWLVETKDGPRLIKAE